MFLNNLVQSCLLHMLIFIDLPDRQVKPEINLPTAISACLKQALISNPGTYQEKLDMNKKRKMGVKQYYSKKRGKLFSIS